MHEGRRRRPKSRGWRQQKANGGNAWHELAGQRHEQILPRRPAEGRH
jgi:hypothetical protein